MVNFWTLCFVDCQTERCFHCVFFSENMSFSKIMESVIPCRSFWPLFRFELYKGKSLIYREASLQ